MKFQKKRKRSIKKSPKARGAPSHSTNTTKEGETGDSRPESSGGYSTPPPGVNPETSIRTVRVPQLQALPEGVPPPPTALETEDYYVVGPMQRLVKQLAGALEYTKWNCFEVLRIGSARQERQVKVLVIVEADSTTWSHAWVVARMCRGILRDFDITDVEVEVQECTGCWAIARIRESVGPEVTVQDCPICH
ncbi:uncharacterized protein FMAN_16266 [Fusarium mangiferae]|uniref:Uncharacterized protein n=1 Tax=Fusarium mangiferae TaxID=192010 RepID=A0A1L7UKH5_FUSMA|nr:uncharacterized protein FMAN_16266 [Fusarium mangiferae]CVL08933.1 uncharacterized protein FMAN_16266 [Fusarium mangiferae]